jgi:ribonuclease HI
MMFTPTYLPPLEAEPPVDGFWKNFVRFFSISNSWRSENRRRYRSNMEQCVVLQRKAVDLVLEEHARLHPTLALSVDELRAISSTQFEDEIARMFTRLGYEVKQTSYSNDGGRDAIMMKDGNKYLVECKRYAKGGLSGRPALQKFHSAIMTDNATSGFFVTTGGFSDPAVKFATENKIELIDAAALVRLMLESRSNSAAANSAEYSSACHFCGDMVRHSLRAPHSVTCQNGHEVKPSLDIETVLKSHHPWDHSRIRASVARTLAMAVLASYGWGEDMLRSLGFKPPYWDQYGQRMDYEPFPHPATIRRKPAHPVAQILRPLEAGTRLPHVVIHTDGAWGAILAFGDHEKELKGGEANTTNNRMELMAAISALEALKRPCRVDLHTDSQYLSDSRSMIYAAMYFARWNGWRTADKKNIDLWQRLDTAMRQHQIDWHWLRDHAGHAQNERADLLARQAIAEIRAGGRPVSSFETTGPRGTPDPTTMPTSAS